MKFERRELLGGYNKGEKEEKKTLNCEDFNHNLVVTYFLLGLREKYNQWWRTQLMISGNASRSSLNVDSHCNYQRSIYGDSDTDIPVLGS